VAEGWPGHGPKVGTASCSRATFCAIWDLSTCLTNVRSIQSGCGVGVRSRTGAVGVRG
jgi:hypothetical protein